MCPSVYDPSDPIEALDIGRERKDHLYQLRHRLLSEEAAEEAAIKAAMERGEFALLEDNGDSAEPLAENTIQPVRFGVASRRLTFDDPISEQPKALEAPLTDAPYGLRGRPDEADVVRMVFRELARPGGSYSALLEALANVGARTASGARFTPVVVRGIVLRVCYCKFVGGNLFNAANTYVRASRPPTRSRR